MKQCPECKNIYNDSLDCCPECHKNLANYIPPSPKEEVTLTEFIKMKMPIFKDKLLKIVVKYLKFILPAFLIIGFVLGFGFKSCTSIKKADYQKILEENKTLSEEKKSLDYEYSAYKTKMQPYENQQAADAKAAADKKLAEEKARQEAEAAEEKARQEAEKKAAAEKKKQETSEMKLHRDGMYGISNKDISEILSDISVQNVKEDVTGNWRWCTISSIEYYALSYYHKYFQNDKEIHYIVNQTLGTTTCLSIVGNILDVSVYEYVDGEYYSAKTMGSGMLLADFYVYLDNGDIQRVAIE